MSGSGWDYSMFWEETLKQIRAEITEQEFSMWFNRLEFLHSEENLIHVSAPSNFYRDQVKQRYLALIEQKLLELSGTDIEVVFEIVGIGAKPAKTASLPTTPAKAQIPTAPNRAASDSTANQLHPLLNAQHTFENFVIGDNNSFAYNASLAIGRNPGKTSYNPCLIYGGVGLGKTHLLQAIGNCVYQHSPEKKILYISMENFFNEFTLALRDQKMHLFKSKYRSVDVLLIDDIHFIQGKEGAQEELFYTFEALRQHQKQMVFSCDRSISELKDITDRIKSRLQQGINVDLQPPSLETRIAIIQKKCSMWSISIPPESITIICENITTNVRDLEAAVTKLKAYAELVSKNISPEITRQQLKDFFASNTQKNITVDLILRIVAQYFGLTHQDMKNKRRTRALAFPRQVAMYIARQITEYSTTEIGLEFGGRDHTTVMHACQRVADRMKSDGTLEPIIRELIRTIKSDGGKS